MTDLSWERRKIRDLGRVITGTTPPTGSPEYFGDKYPFITPSDMSYSKRRIVTGRYMSEKGLKKYRKKGLPTDSVCYTCIGATIGKMCLTKETSFTNQQINSIIVHEENNPLFVYYLLLDMREEINARASGAATPIINKSSFSNVEVKIPLKDIQDKIAYILSSYDDLIEVNFNRIKILEEIAQNLYYEWFVHFRFPGHEDIETIHTKHGPKPREWKTESASQAMLIDPKIKLFKNSDKKYVPMSSLSKDLMVIGNLETRKRSSGSKFQNRDTLFARITPCLEHGKIGFVQFLDGDEVGIGSTEFIVLRSKTLTPEFVYCMARSDRFRNHAIKSMIGASGRQRVQKECFDNFHFSHPPKSLLSLFSRSVSPLFKEIQLLVHKNEILKQTRDMLLPRLISGEIDFNEIDISSFE